MGFNDIIWNIGYKVSEARLERDYFSHLSKIYLYIVLVPLVSQYITTAPLPIGSVLESFAYFFADNQSSFGGLSVGCTFVWIRKDGATVYNKDLGYNTEFLIKQNELIYRKKFVN